MANPEKPTVRGQATAMRLARLGVLGVLVLLSLLLYQDVVAFRGGSSGFYLLIHGLLFALFAAFNIYIGKHRSFNGAHEQALTETTSRLLDSIPAPVLLLNGNDQIVYANDPACAELNTTVQILCTKQFSDLCQDEDRPIPASYGRSAYLMRESMPPLPVCYQTRDLQLLETALPGAEGGQNNQVTVSLLLFSDISDALETSRQLQKVERITSATRIAGEMAHEIQAPLSTLSASVQLLRHYEEKATSADWLPNSPRRNDRRELFEHIEDASARMDSVIRNFIDFAEFSPEDLLSIIKLDSNVENQGYIDHLNTIGRNIKDGQNSHSG